MKHFTSVKDVQDLNALVKQAILLKQNPMMHDIGKNKTLALVFMNPSLRTRMSTQKAAMNLGMQVMVLNIDKEGWALEFNEHAIMNGTTVEHIKDAAAVMGTYADIIGVRAFPMLKLKEEDYSEFVFNSFIKYAKVPIVSLESATLHPLQSFADAITIEENKQKGKRPKVVLTWAPHIKALPQAVPNSFAEWMSRSDVDFVITHPQGMQLAEQFTIGAQIEYNQNAAIKDADFIYVKNWSSYVEYGKPFLNGENWLLNESRLTNSSAKIMHCLPVRRNVELTDELLDGNRSLVLKQAENRIYAAQTVLLNLLQHGK